MNRFTHATNMLLNEFIRNNFDSPLYIDGEARTRTYLRLKRNNQLFELVSKNGEVDFTNKWAAILIEDFIIGHEGDYGDNSYANQLRVVRNLLEEDKLYLLFEDHYGPEQL